MRKFYTLVLSVGMAASMAAAPYHPSELQLPSKPVATMSKVVDSLPRKAKSRAGDFSTIAGEYQITIGDYYFGAQSQGVYTAGCSVSLVNGGGVYFESDKFPIDVLAEYDTETGVITFNEMRYGLLNLPDQQLYVSFNPFEMSFDSGELLFHSFTAQYDPENGKIIFPENHGFSWNGFKDEEYTDHAMYLNLFDVLGLMSNDHVDFNEGWHDYGKAKLTDGWVMPYIMDGDASEYSWEVNLQQSDDNDKVFRLDNPYLADGCPFKDSYASHLKEYGYIVFDVSDPEFVRVLPDIFSGFSDDFDKISCTNLEGYYMAYGYSKNEIIVGLRDQIHSWSTFSDNVVYIPNSRYQYGSSGSMCLVWLSSQKEEMTDYMHTRIEIEANSGVDNIAVAEDAPIEYYNLQGIRVTNPTRAQVVIARQGDKVFKMMVK